MPWFVVPVVASVAAAAYVLGRGARALHDAAHDLQRAHEGIADTVVAVRALDAATVGVAPSRVARPASNDARTRR